MSIILEWLSGKAVYVLAFAVIASGGLYIANQIKEVGRLESINESLAATVQNYETKAALYDTLDEQNREDAEAQIQELNALKRDITELKSNENNKQILDIKLSSDIISRLCEQGLYSSKYCKDS